MHLRLSKCNMLELSSKLKRRAQLHYNYHSHNILRYRRLKVNIKDVMIVIITQHLSKSSEILVKVKR